jgi:hypothetical protein
MPGNREGCGTHAGASGDSSAPAAWGRAGAAPPATMCAASATAGWEVDASLLEARRLEWMPRLAAGAECSPMQTGTALVHPRPHAGAHSAAATDLQQVFPSKAWAGASGHGCTVIWCHSPQDAARATGGDIKAAA